MESIIATLLKQYESGAVTRRELIQGLAALAIAATSTPASAAGLEVSAIDHIQISASDVKRSSEWYQKVLGLKRVRVRETETEKESEVLARVGTGDWYLSLRKQTPVGQLDHIGLIVTGASQESIVRDLKARGAAITPSQRPGFPGNYLHDPDGIRFQLFDKISAPVAKPY